MWLWLQGMGAAGGGVAGGLCVVSECLVRSGGGGPGAMEVVGSKGLYSDM